MPGIHYGEIIVYQSDDGLTRVDVRFEGDTVWLTQAQLIDLYHSSKSNISEHICQAFFHWFGGGMKKNRFRLCQAGVENTSSRISCLIRSSRLVLLFVLDCRKMGYVPLPMLRTSVGFSAAFGSSTTGGLFTLVNEASFPHSWCIDLIAGIWQRL